MKKYNVAVIGATGNVGSMVLNYLYERDFPYNRVEAYASTGSAGKQVSFGEKDRLKLQSLKDINYQKLDIIFMCAGSEVSKIETPKAVGAGCWVIDKSSIFRLDAEVPLIVPEVNDQQMGKISPDRLIDKPGKLIASPNCCVIPIAVALKPLENAAKIKRVVISTYQAVSGAGKAAMDELYNQTKAKYVFENISNGVFEKQIAFNLFPHIGSFREDGLTDEEFKIEEELKKIFGSTINPTVTCVRVPVFVSHSIAVNVEFEKPISADEACEILAEADGVLIQTHENEEKYTTPVEATESDEVYISRIRQDRSKENCLNLWIVSDNLRKGAALNALQIAESLISNN